jgi:hypothetical protein
VWAVDESGHHRHPREIDDGCVVGDLQIGTNCFDLFLANQDQLVFEAPPRYDVEEISRTDENNRRPLIRSDHARSRAVWDRKFSTVDDAHGWTAEIALRLVG